MDLSVRSLFNRFVTELTDHDSPFISTLTSFDQFLNGQQPEDLKKDTVIINDLINHFQKIKNNTFPSYINNIFESFCRNKQRIVIDLSYFNDDYPLLSSHFIINKKEANIVFISNIMKLFSDCEEIEILNKTNITSLYLTQLLAENEYAWNNDTVFKKITFKNVEMIDFEDTILQHHKSQLRQQQYQLMYIDNNLILKRVADKTEKLTECDEYQEILKYAQDELCKLLTNETSNSLLIQCTNCAAIEKQSDIYKDCESIKRIIIILTVYKKLMNHDKLWRKGSILPILTFKNIYTLTQINDDFIHIKDHIEDDDKFGDELYKNLKQQFECTNLDKCHGYERWRYRLKHSYPKMLNNADIIFQGECDKIHSYLMHNEEDKMEQQMDAKRYIGEEQDEEWWDYKNDDEIEDDVDECIYHQLVQNMGIFRWQRPHGFTSKQYEGLMHLKPKYENIKQEVLHNPYYRLSTDQWNQTLRKAVVFFKSFAKQRIKTWYKGKYDDTVTHQKSQWEKGEMINVQEIVTLKLYTDFDKLQYELKKCFRFETIDDIFTLKNFDPNNKHKYYFDPNEKPLRYKLEERLQTFYWWRIQLLTVLNKFGQALNNKVSLYHGVNGKMIINNGKTSSFYGPLSTSSSYHVARTFATAKGMVLQISSQYPRLGVCRGFNASLTSDYPEEKEWLIGFAYLRINTVLTRPLNKSWKTYDDLDNIENYYQIQLSSVTRSIFFAVHLFRQQIFSMSVHLEYWLSAFLYLHCKYNTKHDNDDHGRIKKTDFVKELEETVINNEYKKYDGNKELERYHKILNILWRKYDNFCKYPNQKQVVKIDEISENLKPYFMDYDGHDIQKNEKYIISFTKIIKIFENVTEINFINSYIFDNVALNKLVQYISKNPTHKLKKIKFLYYDYEVIQPNSTNYKTKYYPIDSPYFTDPERLDQSLLNILKQNNWEIKHKDIGKIGYEIQISSIDLKPKRLKLVSPISVQTLPKQERKEQNVSNTLHDTAKEKISDLATDLIKLNILKENKNAALQKLQIENTNLNGRLFEKEEMCKLKDSQIEYYQSFMISLLEKHCDLRIELMAEIEKNRSLESINQNMQIIVSQVTNIESDQESDDDEGQ